jgi:hypothetical protein
VWERLLALGEQRGGEIVVWIEAWHASALKRWYKWERSGMAKHPLRSRNHAETDAEMHSFVSRFYPATNPDKLSSPRIR